jgi:hypothetical protein
MKRIIGGPLHLAQAVSIDGTEVPDRPLYFSVENADMLRAAVDIANASKHTQNHSAT